VDVLHGWVGNALSRRYIDSITKVIDSLSRLKVALEGIAVDYAQLLKETDPPRAFLVRL
jgi:hypothetical protein